MKNYKMKLGMIQFILYFLCFYCVNTALIKSKIISGDNFISNCMNKGSVANESCEESTYSMLEAFYTCKVLGTFNFAPKRISSKNDDLFVAVKRKTFSITNSSNLPVEVNTVVPPSGEIVDKFTNRFYNDDGTTYMIGKQDGKEVEIVTSGSDSLNELALDYENNQLLILSISLKSGKKRSGSLYVLKTDKFEVDNDGKIKATKIADLGTRFSAITITKNSSNILLGVVDGEKSGKLIQLSRNKDDPCSSQLVDKRSDFHKTLREATEQLIKIFDDAITQNHNTGSIARTSISDDTNKKQENELRTLRMENQRLDRDLKVATMRFESYTKRISSFTGRLKTVSVSDDFKKVSVNVNNGGKDLTCLPTQEIETLKSESVRLRNRADMLENIFSQTVHMLEVLGDSEDLLETPGVLVKLDTEPRATATEPNTDDLTTTTDNEDSVETDAEYRARLNRLFNGSVPPPIRV